MLTLNLEALPGDTISETAVEMCAVARRLGLAVSVKFNSVSLTAMVGALAVDVADGYHEEMSSKHPCKVFVAHPPK